MNVKELSLLRDKLAQENKKIRKRILVCCGPGCLAAGSGHVADALSAEIEKHKNAYSAAEGLSFTRTGCHGLCEKGPIVTFYPGNIFYCRVKPGDAAAIVEKTVLKDEIIGKFLYTDPATGRKVKDYTEIDFYSRQTRIALRNVGQVDPLDIKSYIAAGGYGALVCVLGGMKPDDVIDEVGRAGLRGRGGGGFDTARKWRSCKRAKGEPRYVICNGDEGDPGAFMDRAIMEGDPHSVIEGMIIGAFAVETKYGYIYVRQEYPLAVKHLSAAIDQAREYGLLGVNILGSGFDFDIRINRGGGAFVCGESSALMQSIAGKVGEPRAKYIHSVERGLFDKPTVLNNVETWAVVPQIIEKGAEWFASMGTEKSKGTKAFCIVGKVENTGLVEIPMGTTLRELVFDVAGGIKGGKHFKAVQTGGPSGGCIPESLLELPVDFEKLTVAGSMMGSGGMIVMDQSNCMVDVAKYFLEFLMDESCGKCVPCREGLQQLHVIVDSITKGEASGNDLQRIADLSQVIKAGSLCALGKSAPNPVLSTLQYFRDEYETHIRDKKCPAAVCRALITYTINEKCNGCGACVKVCPVNAISGCKQEIHVLDQVLCTKCGACHEVCQYEAIDVR